MPSFFNPFRKHDVRDFPGVLVSLRDAPRHPSAAREDEEKAGGIGTSLGPDAEKGRSPSRDEYSLYTIERLKLEIEEDVAAAAHDTVYDRMCHRHLLALSPKSVSMPGL